MTRYVRLAALLAVAAASAASTYAAGPDQQQPTPVKEKKVCRRSADTGSILPKTVCRLQKDWDKMSEKGQEDARAVREASQTGIGTVSQ